MKVFLREISEDDTDLEFTEEAAWVLRAVQQVDEQSEGMPVLPKSRPVQAHFSLRKVDEVIFVTGEINTHVELICSRCAHSFNRPCPTHFSALFCKDPVLAGVAHLQHQYLGPDRTKVSRPVGQNQGFARHAHDTSMDQADGHLISSGKDLDITYLSHEYIDLGEVLTEQLQFQVPFQPLCKEDCKGVCPHCGTDLNSGRCACAKINKTSPFSVLNPLKI